MALAVSSLRLPGGDSVWDIYQLGAGVGILGWKDGWGILREVIDKI